jgi:hypothetical protein
VKRTRRSPRNLGKLLSWSNSALKDGSLVPSIELGIGLDAFPVFGSFVPSALYCVAFAVFFMEWRWPGYIPTVSETGSEFPNARLMELVFLTVAVTIFFSGFVLYRYFISFYPTRLLTRLFLILGIVSGSLRILFPTAFPVAEDPPRHFGSAFVRLGGIVLSQFIFWFIPSSRQSSIACFARFVLVFGQMAALIAFGYVEWIAGTHPSVRLSALGKYTFLLLPFFLASFAGDLARSDEYVVDLGD